MSSEDLALSGLDDTGAVRANEARLALAHERVLYTHPAPAVRNSEVHVKLRARTCPAGGYPP